MSQSCFCGGGGGGRNYKGLLLLQGELLEVTSSCAFVSTFDLELYSNGEQRCLASDHLISRFFNKHLMVWIRQVFSVCFYSSRKQSHTVQLQIHQWFTIWHGGPLRCDEVLWPSSALRGELGACGMGTSKLHQKYHNELDWRIMFVSF